jgi:ribonuclease HII
MAGAGIRDIKAVYEKLDFADKDNMKEFVEKFGGDTRSGVRALVEKTEKKIAAYDAEIERSIKMLQFEKKYYEQGAEYICGIDEVGRGPFAGPVVAGAVILPKDELILELNDSKQLTKAKREELYDVITEKAVAWAIGISSEKVIDEINILQATFVAMREAVGKLSVRPDVLLNDAVDIPELDIKQVPIIKGDTLSASIAAASIVAKVTRDRMMEEYDDIYPGYYFADNAGYGVPKHIAALKELGPCPIHRRTFIKKYVNER